MKLMARTNRGVLADWWWSIDRWQLFLCFILVGFGLLMALAASPAVAQKLDKSIYHFANKQFIFLLIGASAIIAISCLSPQNIRRMAIALLTLSLLGMGAILLWGTEIKGAARWFYIFGISIQPSEFMKPAFVVVCAWLLARQNTHFESSGGFYTFALMLIASGLLVLQPDFGQTSLLILVWSCIYFLAGGSLRLLAVLIASGAVMAVVVYTEVDHVRSRIDRYLDPSSGDTYQVDRAMDAIAAGGITGVGPGNGRVKSMLPDAHTDYVFAVAVEEGGFILAVLIVLVYAALIWRCMLAFYREEQHWVQLAIGGLTCLFGVQACINLAVNLDLIPSKGMTLPFISYGGSSLIASAITIGMVVGLSRRRGRGVSETRVGQERMRFILHREVVS